MPLPLPWASFSSPPLEGPWGSGCLLLESPFHSKNALTLVSSGQSNYEQSKSHPSAAGKDPHHVGIGDRTHADSVGASDHREKQWRSKPGAGGHQASWCASGATVGEPDWLDREISGRYR